MLHIDFYNIKTKVVSVEASSAGLLKALEDLSKLPREEAVKFISFDVPAGTKREVIVNFAAAVQKNYEHLLFVLGWSKFENTNKRIWRQYWKACIDAERGIGPKFSFKAFLRAYVRKNQSIPTISEPLWEMEFDESDMVTKISFRCSVGLDSVAALAALARLVTLFRWVQSTTPSLKLVTNTKFKWETFDSLSTGDSKILKRKKRF